MVSRFLENFERKTIELSLQFNAFMEHIQNTEYVSYPRYVVDVEYPRYILYEEPHYIQPPAILEFIHLLSMLSAGERESACCRKYEYCKLCSDDRERYKNCSICFEDFVSNDKVMLTECKHLFHTTCMENWFKQKMNCPICRKTL
jgi:hypothetical protein